MEALEFRLPHPIFTLLNTPRGAFGRLSRGDLTPETVTTDVLAPPTG